MSDPAVCNLCVVIHIFRYYLQQFRAALNFLALAYDWEKYKTSWIYLHSVVVWTNKVKGCWFSSTQRH